MHIGIGFCIQYGSLCNPNPVCLPICDVTLSVDALIRLDLKRRCVVLFVPLDCANLYYGDIYLQKFHFIP